jgi:uncharacterized protein
MQPNGSRQLFVNLAVSDLARSMQFFRALGFDFDQKYTDDKAACLVIGDGAYAMLLTDPFFRGFTKREPCDTRTHTEALLAISCGDRQEVDEMTRKALAGGGSPAMEAQDLGFMYSHSFYDPDGHHWEVFWMDSAANPVSAQA